MKFSLILFYVILFSACISVPEKPRDNELAGVYHRVKKGDSLSIIATRYRSSIDEIKEVNGIEHEKSLHVGRELFIPDPDPIGTRIKKFASRKPTANKALHAQKSRVGKEKAHNESKEKLFSFPVAMGQITRHFSADKKSPHDGITIRAARDTPVLASQKGKVIFVGDDGTRFGLLVLIEHQDPFITVYTHLERSSVKIGDYVQEKQPIGTVGSSGGLAHSALHFQIRVAERPQDPERYLKNILSKRRPTAL